MGNENDFGNLAFAASNLTIDTSFAGPLARMKKFTSRPAQLSVRVALALKRRFDQIEENFVEEDKKQPQQPKQHEQSQEEQHQQPQQQQELEAPQEDLPKVKRIREEIEFSNTVSEASQRHALKHFKKLQETSDVVGGALGGWEDAEDTKSAEIAKTILHAQKKQERSALKARELDDWNAALDAGRTKKTKKMKQANAEMNGHAPRPRQFGGKPSLNPFQNAQMRKAGQRF